ncbi:MAG: hypothetical protein KAJ24_01610 [Candidatus Aenigmarchaeota archaeon]|nr:hypothetical protein [Candidatus Aenigmarchaeota archaeon]
MRNKNNILLAGMAIFIFTIAISGCADNNSDISTADAKTELKNILSKRDTLEYKISYTVNTAEFENAAMTQYMKGTNMRIDSIVDGVESQAYIKESGIYSCAKAPEGWLCFGFETTNSIKEQISYIPAGYLDENPEAYNVMRMEKRRIAGASAQCYKSENTQDNSYFETCYSSDNVPLHIMVVSSEPGVGVMEMTATSYSTSVSDRDFELPAEPMDVGNFMDDLLSDPCKVCDTIPIESRQECLAECNA